MDNDKLKQLTAEKAVTYIQSGMVVGMGHGSTALKAAKELGRLIREGKLREILVIPCSKEIEQELRSQNVPLTKLNEHPSIDLTIDGADEVDPKLNLIKGGGGALLREKIVARASKKEIIIVDESKLSDTLGKKSKLPIEVVPIERTRVEQFLQSLGARTNLRVRKDGSDFKTEQENIILDCDFGSISNPYTLAEKLDKQLGIVEHGLFLDIASEVIVAGKNGVKILRR